MLVSVNRFTDAVCAVVPDCTVYLTGSAAAGDYRHGWSDIDMLFLTRTELTADTASALVNLRQTYADDPYIPRIEGGIVSADAFLSGAETVAVYWGTSGQRICGGYTSDCFTLAQAENWICLRGEDVRHRIPMPSPDALYAGVKRHWETIRDYAARTQNPMYRCGWMLDIARCLYTLKTGRVAAKTYAGEYALRNGWCPDADALRDALAVRYDPSRTRHITDEAIADFNAVLGDALTKGMKP
ncbi:MAG: DUF4111 domain-containing protein [Clostridia bacterium]|nr:DUF4111 domain-containing protein [Clostridia bacterium]MBQ8332246.1 DUF4111 domain-containing protein [Clostridia bacterium]MBQ8369291.1 DUF4111 domain-containing protein [Clostridia bacterium]MBQ8513055.1 DUF4111 domain-containing protein [Clostridia bacterium]